MRHCGTFYSCVLVALVLLVGEAAAVSDQEAAQLKSRLTPVGAERAGNAAGTIPPWMGGYTVNLSNYRNGEPRLDPFVGERALFSITAKNFESYSDRLPEGAKRLFEKNPGYRMDIYRSHRTAAAPEWV